MAGFPFTRQVGRQRFAHEAATLRVRFRYGSRICFLRLQPTVFRRVLLRSLHVRTSNLHGGLLTSHKIKPGLSWRTARKQAMPDRPKNHSLAVVLVANRARKQAMPDRPKNHSLTVVLVASRARKQ